MIAELQVVDSAAAARLVLDPARRAVLAALREPASAAAVAQSLGLPRQRVGYHLRSLAEHGFVLEVGQRQWGGITERLFVASAAAYVVSTDALGDLGVTPARMTDRISARYLVALAAQVIRDLGQLVRRAEAQGRPLATLSIDTTIRFASAAERASFADELAATVRALAGRYHRAGAHGGRDHHLIVMTYPTAEETDMTEEKV